MPESRHEHPARPVLCRPQHWLVNARARNRLTRLALIERVVVVCSRQHVIAALGLPAQVGVELVGRDTERFQPARDRMLGVLDVDGEIVTSRMVTVVRPPVAAAHLFVFRPPVERAESEVIEHETFAGADERVERRVCALTPAILVAAVVVVDDDEIVVGERLGARASELLVDAHLEASGRLENLLQDRRGAAPVVHVLTSDEEDLDLRGVRWRARLRKD